MSKLLFFALFFLTELVMSHPGRLASDGCHYDGDIRHSHDGSVCESRSSYSRKRFKHWIDSDGDCRNRRAEILKERSLVDVQYSVRKNGDKCTVSSGKWQDYYFPEVHTDASNVDMDHIVPLKHAWDEGAKTWSDAKREEFANDPANLVITNKSYNRQKGAQSPLSWAPSEREYYCKYLNDWIKVKTKYALPIDKKIHEYQVLAKCE